MKVLDAFSVIVKTDEECNVTCQCGVQAQREVVKDRFRANWLLPQVPS
jgi:hypothetical protein